MQKICLKLKQKETTKAYIGISKEKRKFFIFLKSF